MAKAISRALKIDGDSMSISIDIDSGEKSNADYMKMLDGIISVGGAKIKVDIDAAVYDENGNVIPEVRNFLDKFGSISEIASVFLGEGLVNEVQPRELKFEFNDYGSEFFFGFYINDEGAKIDRNIFVNKQTGVWEIEHSYFKIPEERQSSGAAVKMMKSAVDWYTEKGIRDINIYASLENGGYTWSKFGAIPDKPDHLLRNVAARTNDLYKKGKITEEQALKVEGMILENLSAKEKKSWGLNWAGSVDNMGYDFTIGMPVKKMRDLHKELWKLSDLKDETKVTFDGKRKKTLGQALFAGLDWEGKISLKRGSVERRRALEYIEAKYKEKNMSIPENYVKSMLHR